MTEFQQLEASLNSLIKKYQLMEVENNSLKTKQNELVREKAKLLEKNSQARTRVEAMIMRLKSMEQH